MRITLDIDIEKGNAEVADTWPLAPYVTEPCGRDQQQALFAMFTKVYGTRDPDARHAFTKAVLAPEALWYDGSWSRLSKDEAHRMLSTLEVIEAMCDHFDGI